MEAEGRDVIHLEVGQPDFPTPNSVIDYVGERINDSDLGYTAASGMPALRGGIVDYYAREFGVAVDRNQVIVTAGASGALVLALSALSSNNGVMLMTNPGYPCNGVIARAFGSKIRYVQTGMHTPRTLVSDFERDWPDEPVDAVVIASPVNPTGEVLPLSVISEIGELARARGAVLVVDEIYQGLVYDEPACTALSALNDVVIVNSFSKRFAMTGWRVGWAVAPHELIDRMDRLAQNLFLAPCTVSQYAALAALDEGVKPELLSRVEALKARRDYLVQSLEGLGLSLCFQPEGAFYLLVDVSGFGLSGVEFCDRLLEAQGVVLTPGSDFFVDYRGDQTVRIAYTANVARLEQAVERIKQFVGSLPCNSIDH